MKEDLVRLEDVDKLSAKTVKEYYLKHINVGIPKFLSMLCLDGLQVENAEGIFINTKCGRKIYDFTGGFSVLNLGHNHPRIMQARKTFNEKNFNLKRDLSVIDLFFKEHKMELSFEIKKQIEESRKTPNFERLTQEQIEKEFL